MYCDSDNGKVYYFLKNNLCKCMLENIFIMETSSIIQESTSYCNIPCQGNTNYICGGMVELDDYYSVYEVISDRTKTKTSKVGHECGSAKIKYEYLNCNFDLRNVCEQYTSDNYYRYDCSSTIHTWYEAQRDCQKKNMQLISSNKLPNCKNSRSSYWIGYHVEEKIIWNKDDLPIKGNFGCLSLHVDEDKAEYEFEVHNCTEQLQSLYYKSKLSTEKQADNSTQYIDYSTEQTIGRGEQSTITHNTIDRTSTIVTIISVSGAVMLIIVVVVIGICIKRRRKTTVHKQDLTLLPTENDNSEPRMNSRTPVEQHELINNTEDDLYNHLGDTGVTLTTSGAVYGALGHDENEYDVSGANNRSAGLKATGGIYDIMGHDENEYDVSGANKRGTGLKAIGGIYDIMGNGENEYDAGDANGRRESTEKMKD